MGPSRTSLLNMSPMAWGTAMALLFTVVFPAYLIDRFKHRTRNGGSGFLVARTARGGVLIVLLALNMATTPALALVWHDLPSLPPARQTTANSWLVPAQ